MTLGIIGKKCGMSRVFDESGVSIPVTLVHFEKNYVSQIKQYPAAPHNDKGSFYGVQVACGYGSKSVTKAVAGHLKKVNLPADLGYSREFQILGNNPVVPEVGSEVTLEILKDQKYVHVAGVTKGKGFAGTIKRHHFAGQDKTHGNSLSHRAPGSIGQRQTPGRVFKGKKMSGHMGNVMRTQKNLKIVEVNFEKSILVIKGSVSGPTGTILIVKPAN